MAAVHGGAPDVHDADGKILSSLSGVSLCPCVCIVNVDTGSVACEESRLHDQVSSRVQCKASSDAARLVAPSSRLGTPATRTRHSTDLSINRTHATRAELRDTQSKHSLKIFRNYLTIPDSVNPDDMFQPTCRRRQR